MGPEGVRAPPPPTSSQSGQAYREEGSVALSLPGNPCPGQLSRLTGGKVCTVPPENSLGELPYCAPGSPPGWPGVGRGLCCPRDTLTPEWLAWPANGKSIPPLPLLCTLTLWEVCWMVEPTSGPFDQRLLSVGASPYLTPAFLTRQTDLSSPYSRA